MATKYNIQSEKLLITGVSGYIGFKTLITALEKGYRVRGVIRSQHNAVELPAMNPLVAEAFQRGQLEFALVPDFLKAGALDQALEDITVVVHLASPLANEGDDYEANIVEPATSMVTTVLKAAANVSTVRRVIITSSCVTLIPFEWNMNPDNEKLYTVKDINDHPVRPFNSAMEAYWASKALSRMAIRNYISQQSPGCFDVITLLPSVVIGPDERATTTTALVQGTRAAVLAPVLTSSQNSPFPYVGTPVHVADVALIHIDAVDNTRIPGNSEYILSSDTPEGIHWDTVARDVAHKHFPEDVGENRILPLQGSLATIKWRLDAMSTEQAFGWKFTGFEDTMRQLIEQYVELQKKLRDRTT